MSGIFKVDRAPVKVVSVNADNLDVDVVANKNLIILGASKTAGHLVVDTGTAATSTRIVYGVDDGPAKLIKKDGVTEVLLWGNAVNRFALLAGEDGVGVLINLNAYSIKDWPQDADKAQLVFTSAHTAYPNFDIAAIYKWSTTQEAFVWERDTDPANDASPLPNGWVFSRGPLPLLDGVLIYLEGRTCDVDEDGPHMQKHVDVSSPTAYTQYSIYRETTTTSYSANMIESLACDAVAIQLNDGTQSAEKYKQMTTQQGLELVNRMRSISYRDYAPPGACDGATQKAAKIGLSADGKLIAEPVRINGKESNYSLSNLVKRYDFWQDYVDELGGEYPLYYACGSFIPWLQNNHQTGLTPVADDITNWAGPTTFSAPRIKSYAPRFIHVEYNSREHLLTWQEQTVRSFILFNNFEPTGKLIYGAVPFGMGGGLVYGSSYADDDDETIS